MNTDGPEAFLPRGADSESGGADLGLDSALRSGTIPRHVGLVVPLLFRGPHKGIVPGTFSLSRWCG